LAKIRESRSETYIGWFCSNVIQADGELSVLIMIQILALLKRKWMQLPIIALSIKDHLYVLYQRYTISTSRHCFQRRCDDLLPLTDCISSGLCSCFMVIEIRPSSFSLNTHLTGSVFGVTLYPVRSFVLSNCVRDKARRALRLSYWHNIHGKMEVGCSAG
jgi:hypothetical protein